MGAIIAYRKPKIPKISGKIWPKNLKFNYLEPKKPKILAKYWLGPLPVALNESITMSLSIPICPLVLYIKTLSERFSFFIFQNFRRWNLLKELQ